VKAEGTLVLDNYDIVKKTGANFTAATESFVVNVADGALNLHFSALVSEDGVNRPKVSAIEVISVMGANLFPVAQAGADQTITLPASSLTLAGGGSDTDGSISAYTWSQVSGPNEAGFSSTSAQNLTVSNLVAGTYTFSLVVTDDQNGASTADQVVVTVNPDPAALAQASHRINAGGTQQTTSQGTFAADNYFAPAPGYTFTSANPIAGTDNDALYQTERISSTDNGSFSYALPVRQASGCLM
jgi:large repetitive protein